MKSHPFFVGLVLCFLSIIIENKSRANGISYPHHSSMDSQNLVNQYALKELELNALLEVTQAINNNLPEESLYKIFNFTLRANLQIRKLALYVLNEHDGTNETWECKANFGTETDFSQAPLLPDFFRIDSIAEVKDFHAPGPFQEFDILIPVSHKDHMLALVFIGGVGAADEGSPEISTNFIQALSNIIVVAIENKKLARRQLEQEAIRKEMEIAREVQQFLFPKVMPDEKGLRVLATYLPHHSVGGDYYDFISLSDEQFIICVADVSGKGIPAALLMSNFQAALRALVRKTSDLKEIVRELNYQIFQSANGENYITAFIAHYDRKNFTLRYVNAGHTPPILIHNNQEIQLLTEGTLILGSFEPLPFLREGKMEKLKNFFFFGYTDGLTETFNAEDEQYGAERLEGFLIKNYGQNLQNLHEKLIATLDEFSGSGEHHDDITFLSLKVGDEA